MALPLTLFETFMPVVMNGAGGLLKTLEKPLRDLGPLEKLVYLFIHTRNGGWTHTRETAHASTKHFLESVIEELSPYIEVGSTGIDIGAGYGLFSECAGQYEVTNLDPNPPPSASAAYVSGYAQDIPFGRASFDFAVFLYAFHHMEDKVTALDEARRVVRPGGKIVALLEFPRYDGQEFFLRVNEVSINSMVNGTFDPTETLEYFSESAFKALTSKMGLKPVFVKGFNPVCWYDPLIKSRKCLYVLEVPG